VRLIEGVGTDGEKWSLLKYAVDHELMEWLQPDKEIVKWLM
jgi:hypothetical protein